MKKYFLPSTRPEASEKALTSLPECPRHSNATAHRSPPVPQYRLPADGFQQPRSPHPGPTAAPPGNRDSSFWTNLQTSVQFMFNLSFVPNSNRMSRQTRSNGWKRTTRSTLKKLVFQRSPVYTYFLEQRHANPVRDGGGHVFSRQSTARRQRYITRSG